MLLWTGARGFRCDRRCGEDQRHAREVAVGRLCVRLWTAAGFAHVRIRVRGREDDRARSRTVPRQW